MSIIFSASLSNNAHNEIASQKVGHFKATDQIWIQSIGNDILPSNVSICNICRDLMEIDDEWTHELLKD